MSPGLCCTCRAIHEALMATAHTNVSVDLIRHLAGLLGLPDGNIQRLQVTADVNDLPRVEVDFLVRGTRFDDETKQIFEVKPKAN